MQDPKVDQTSSGSGARSRCAEPDESQPSAVSSGASESSLRTDSTAGSVQRPKVGGNATSTQPGAPGPPSPPPEGLLKRAWKSFGRELTLQVLGTILGVLAAFAPWVKWYYDIRGIRGVYATYDRNSVDIISADHGLLRRIRPPVAVIGKAILADVDEDGKDEVIIGTSQDGFGSDSAGQVWVYTHTGRPKWHKDTFDTAVVRHANGISNHFATKFIYDGKVMHGRGRQVVVVASDPLYYINRVIVYNASTGDVLADCLHPGQIESTNLVDLDGDGLAEVVCTAVNNDLDEEFAVPQSEYCPVVFMWKPVLGEHAQSAPGRIGSLPLPSVGWYVSLMPSGYHLMPQIVPGGRPSVHALEIWTGDGRIYGFTADGECTKAEGGDGWPRFYPGRPVPFPIRLTTLGAHEWRKDTLYPSE
jgi:hypothetical protein